MVRLGGGAESELVARMGRALDHRGPDQAGQYNHASAPLGIALATRRLAILDLSASGNQPMASADGLVRLAYNGELYNEPELRAGLAGRGWSYYGHGDTETVLGAYELDGPDSFSRFNGMFALAIADRRRQRVVLARDRMGIKPLYYTWDGRRLVFASELRCLVGAGGVPAEIDAEALDLYLACGYVPSPHCLIAGVRKLPPGSYLVLDADGNLAEHEFWRPVFPSPSRLSAADAAEAVRAAVSDAVRRQMRSDVPVGVLLSGGVDSTIVAAAAAATTDLPLQTFTVGFASRRSAIGPELNADADYARRVAATLGTTHREIVVEDDARLAGVITDLAVGLDEPTWEASFVSIHAISTLARSHGVKVLLSGDGGDELFLGYPWHASAWRQQRYERLVGLRTLASVVASATPERSVIGRHARNLGAVIGLDHASRYEWSHAIFPAAQRRALAGSQPRALLDGGADVSRLEDLARRLLVDADANGRRGLGDHLALLDLSLWVREHFNQRVDRMTMLNSVESRVPFQDNDVVDLALALPADLKAPRGQAKGLLKRAFRAELPDFVAQRPKRPFAAPMRSWANGALRPFVRSSLSTERVAAAGLLDPAAVARVVAASERGATERANERLWALLMLQLWAEGIGRLAQSDDDMPLHGVA